ncbi:MAG: hypothetical protein ACI8V2_003281 [Candidatus Latescibacterota bacterium]|jgi:hypothetical protein
MSSTTMKEVRHIRHLISEECDHDVQKVLAYYHQIEQELRASGKYRFEETSNQPENTALPK